MSYSIKCSPGRLFTLLLLLVCIKATAQIDYPTFKSKTEINPADSQQLSFNLYNLNYINNTEWFGNIPLERNFIWLRNNS